MAQLARIRLMSGNVSRGSAGEYQADERAGVARLSWRLSGIVTFSMAVLELVQRGLAEQVLFSGVLQTK